MNISNLLCIEYTDNLVKEIFVMERFNTCDMRNKEVINLCDGTVLGCPSDFEFNTCDGKITALVIGGQGGFLGFGQCEDLIIPWNKIECIGEDAILVRLLPSECNFPKDNRKKSKKGLW